MLVLSTSLVISDYSISDVGLRLLQRFVGCAVRGVFLVNEILRLSVFKDSFNSVKAL